MAQEDFFLLGWFPALMFTGGIVLLSLFIVVISVAMYTAAQVRVPGSQSLSYAELCSLEELEIQQEAALPTRQNSSSYSTTTSAHKQGIRKVCKG